MFLQTSFRIAPGLAALATFAVVVAVSTAQNVADRPQPGEAFLIYRESRVELPGGKTRTLTAGTWGKAVAVEGQMVLGIVSGAKLPIPLANVACGRAGVARLSKEIRDRPMEWTLYLCRADLRRKLKDYDAAFDDVAAIPEDAREYPNSILYRGVIKRDQEDWQGAVDDLTAALELTKAARDRRAMAYIHLYRGPAYYRLDNLDAAIDDIDQAIKLGYDDAEAHRWRGTLLVQKGQTDLAFEALKKAKELDPYDKEVRVALAQLYEHLKLFGPALAELDEVLEWDQYDLGALSTRARMHIHSQDFDAALEDVERALAIDANHSESLLTKGMVLYEKGDRNGLAELCKHLVQVDISDPKQLYSRAYMLVSAEMNTEAMSDLNKCLAGRFRDPKAFVLRSLLFSHRKDWNRALADADQAVKLNPRISESYYLRGIAKAAMREYAAALEDLNRAIYLNDRDVESYTSRSQVQLALGNKAGANADLRTAVALNPNNEELAVAFLAMLANEKRLDEYGVVASESINRFSDDAMNYWRRASFWGGMGNHRMAIADLTEAIRMNPSRGNFFTWRAASFLELARLDLAIEDIEAAERLGSLDAVGTYTKARVLEGQGDYGRAVDIYRTLIEGPRPFPPALGRLARVYATAGDHKIRDGRKALVLAKQVCAAVNYGEARPLSYLAAAHAELGEFGDAVEWQAKALSLARDLDREEMARQLELYKAEKPYRHTPIPRVAAKLE